MSDKHTGRGRRLWALEVVALCASAGVLAAAYWAHHEIAEERYAHVGFWRTIGFLLRGKTVRGFFLGSSVGACFAAAYWAAGRLRASREGPRTPWRSIGSSARHSPATVYGLLATVAVLAILAVRRGAVEAPWVLGVVACLAIWCVAHAVFRAPWGAALFALGLSGPVLALCIDRRAIHEFFGLEMLPGDSVIALGALALGLWLALERRASAGSRAAWWSSRALALILALPAVVVLALAARWSQKPTELAAARPLNVLIIGIDTLRFDRTSLATDRPDGRDLTPSLARLATRGAVFENAITQAPWTMPAFASVFTGVYPFEHAAISKTGRLRKSEITLSEILREAGYTTASIVSHYFVNNTHGFGQGYDYFNRDMVGGEDDISSAGITDRALEFLERQDRKPFFLFLHYFDPHNDYQNHPETDFADWYQGWIRHEMEIGNLRYKRHLFTPDDVRYLRDLYDEEIVHTDREVGRVLDELERRGLDQNTLVVVVADHGEEIMERGWLGHSITLYDEVIRVPLVVVVPGVTPAAPRVRDTVETRAIFATVLDALGVRWRETRWEDSLLPLVRGESRSEPMARTAYSSVWTPDIKTEVGLGAQIVALRKDRWKLVHDYSRGVSQIFDLAEDPDETADLAQRDPERLAELEQELESWMKGMRAALKEIPQRGAVEAEMRERLRALGYL